MIVACSRCGKVHDRPRTANFLLRQCEYRCDCGRIWSGPLPAVLTDPGLDKERVRSALVVALANLTYPDGPPCGQS